MTEKNEIAVATPSRARLWWTRFGKYLLLAAAALLLAGGGYYAWRTWFGPDQADEKLLTAVAQRGDLEDTITATGTLQPKDYVDVGTQVSGQLKTLAVALGAVVKAGDLLAEIDPTVYLSKVDADQAQLQNQQAQLTDRQAQLALASLQYTRQKNLSREDATSADALQSAEAGQKSAQAQVDAIRAQMRQTESTLRGDQANLGYTKIHAPIAGTVVSQTAKQGQTLNANQQAPIVMRIADLSTMTVQAQVSEADVPKLRIGMAVYFTTLGGDQRRYYGVLRQIPPTPTVVNNVVLYDALFDVPNPDQALMTQMTAQVFFVAASAKNALLVPLAALHPVGRKPGAGAARKGNGGTRPAGAEKAGGIDQRSLFANGRALLSVVGADGKAIQREVKVGVTNRVSAQILSGLEAGEKVVIGSQSVNAPAKPQSATTNTQRALATPTGPGRP